MKYVVIVHVKGAGALTSPIFGSLDLAEADVTKIRRFQRADVMRLNFRRSVPQHRRSPFPPGE